MPIPEQDSLANAIASVGRFVHVGAQIPRYGTADQDLAVVATAILRKAYLQGQAVLLLAGSENPETAVPNLRSMLEAFGELHYLLTGEGSGDRAKIAFLFALRELRDFLARWNDLPEDLPRIEHELAEKERLAPNIAATAQTRRNNWTPVGRAELVEQALSEALKTVDPTFEGEAGRKIYKLLSWDEHHVMATLLSVELSPTSPDRGRIKRQEAPDEPETFLPFLATVVLTVMERLFLRAFPEAAT